MLKIAVGITLFLVSAGIARCVAWSDYWNHVPHRVGGIVYAPYETPICEEPNLVYRLLDFPPTCH